MLSTRAIICEDFGEPEVMKLGTKTIPSPSEGQVLVRMGAAGVNPSDTYVRLGPLGPWAATPHLLPTPPFTPGKDGAGVVLKAGDGVSYKEGDRVYLTNSLTGTTAEHALCTVTDVWPLPDRISFAQGACVGVPCSTAYRALAIRCAAQKGEAVFIHGASGAVGLAAVQLAVDMGCFVVGSAGTPEGRAAVTDAGAHAVVDHRSEGYLEEAKDKTEGGFNMCLEMMASSNLVADTSIMARHGRIAIVGSKPVPIAFNPRLTMPLELDIRGVFSPSSTQQERVMTHRALFDYMDRGALTPVVSVILAMEEMPKAHVEVVKPSRGGALGNIVIKCSDIE